MMDFSHSPDGWGLYPADFSPNVPFMMDLFLLESPLSGRILLSQGYMNMYAASPLLGL